MTPTAPTRAPSTLDGIAAPAAAAPTANDPAPTPSDSRLTPPAAPGASTAPPTRSLLGRVAGVDLVVWPTEAHRRRELAALGLPALLVLAPGDPVPRLSLLEDWAREPLEADDLVARCRALARRVECGTRPTLDDGLLLHRGAWAAIPPAQVEMVALLVERMGSVVRKDELVAAAASAGGSSHADAVKAAMARLGRRLTPLGLVLRSVRGRGYLLEESCGCPVHGSRSAAEA